MIVLCHDDKERRMILGRSIWKCLLVALSYLAGEAAQLSLGVPAASTQVFQGLLLFFLLGTSLFVNYRVRLGQVA